MDASALDQDITWDGWCPFTGGQQHDNRHDICDMCADIRGSVGSHSDICIQITDAQEENAAESGSGSGT